MLPTFRCGWLAGNNKRPTPFETLDAAVAAVCAYDVCGEIATAKTQEKNGGVGTFRTELLDAVTITSPETLSARAKVETISLD